MPYFWVKLKKCRIVDLWINIWLIYRFYRKYSSKNRPARGWKVILNEWNSERKIKCSMQCMSCNTVSHYWHFFCLFFLHFFVQFITFFLRICTNLSSNDCKMYKSTKKCLKETNADFFIFIRRKGHCVELISDVMLQTDVPFFMMIYDLN